MIVGHEYETKIELVDRRGKLVVELECIRHDGKQRADIRVTFRLTAEDILDIVALYTFWYDEKIDTKKKFYIALRPILRNEGDSYWTRISEFQDCYDSKWGDRRKSLAKFL